MDAAKEERLIYFVRHGESEANVSPAFGDPSAPLTDHGRHQAQQLAERFSKISFAMLIASPLPRAQETAGIISAKTKRNVVTSDFFTERTSPSSLLGKSRDDIHAVNLWNRWCQSIYRTGDKVEDGENFTDVVLRADHALAFLEHQTESGIVVVTHGFFLRTVLLRIILGESLTPEILELFQRHTAIANTGISLIRHAPTNAIPWRVLVINDHAHLG